ncbi:MAG: SRPBCC family protein, partial [Armatimonadota bacterium]
MPNTGGGQSGTGLRQRSPRRPSLSPAQQRQFMLGIINANVLAALLINLTIWLSSGVPGGGSYGTSATVLIPLLMGFMAAYNWRHLPLTGSGLALGALLNTIVGLATAYFFLHEGIMCLVMVSPLLYLMVLVSTLISAAIVRPKPGPLAVSVVPILMGALLYDCWNPAKEYRSAVTTSVVIQAPPDVVFPHTVAFPPIPSRATSLLNSAGLPWPVLTTVDTVRVGGERRSVFSSDLTVVEKITELTPGKSITFRITGQPRYPEFTNHGKLLQGRSTVTDN